MTETTIFQSVFVIFFSVFGNIREKRSLVDSLIYNVILATTASIFAWTPRVMEIFTLNH